MITTGFSALNDIGKEQMMMKNSNHIAISPNSDNIEKMDFKEAVELYKSVGHRNADFLFGWLYKIYSKVYLPCIDLDFRETLVEDKTKLTIYDVLIDDVADNSQMRSEWHLEQFLQIPWNYDSTYVNEYVEAGRRIWKSCIESIENYPRFEEFERLFYFDLRQVLSSMEYSYLVNTMGMDNPLEDRYYLSHGCMVILHCDMDLMCSPDFNTDDLGNMRRIFHIIQRIAHIGNILNTYPREIEERDFSSSIISRAIRRGIIREDQLSIENLSMFQGLEEEYKREVWVLLEDIQAIEDQVESVNIRGFSEKMEHVFESFLAREQYWKVKDQNTAQNEICV
jgi:hypothetical protein